MPTIMSLMKICEEKQYADCFLSGKLHSNRLGYFRDQDIDRYEGAIWQQPDRGRFTLNGRLIPPEDFAGQIRTQLRRVDNLHLFCMFALHSGGFEPLSLEKADAFKTSQLGSINDCAEDFGPYTVVIANTQEFLKRVDAAPRRMHQEKRILQYRRGLVKYGCSLVFTLPFSGLLWAWSAGDTSSRKHPIVSIAPGLVG